MKDKNPPSLKRLPLIEVRSIFTRKAKKPWKKALRFNSPFKKPIEIIGYGSYRVPLIYDGKGGVRLGNPKGISDEEMQRRRINL